MPLVYYAYHIMVGLGTILLLIAVLGVFLLWRGRLFESRPMLWALMLAFPFTYIANIAGWTTAETARQPWVVYGLLRTADGSSPPESVPAGHRDLHTARLRGSLPADVASCSCLIVVRIVAQGPRTCGAAGDRPQRGRVEA